MRTLLSGVKFIFYITEGRRKKEEGRRKKEEVNPPAPPKGGNLGRKKPPWKVLIISIGASVYLACETACETA
jgi:hypothetical protein